MHTDILFEHPLNEKMRTWLRIEFLLKQMNNHMAINDHSSALSFFRNTADLLDVFERSEMRTDLLKDLERQQRRLQAWTEVPGVDNERISTLIQQLKQSAGILMAAPRPGQTLREERLISTVRQRLSIPGGCCSFDLPILHIWLHLPQSCRDEQVSRWVTSLQPVSESLIQLLEITRNSAIFRQQTCTNGFYQDNSDDMDLLRLQLDIGDELYPQISGHKNRFAIRFLPIDNENGKVPEQINFALACC